MSEPITERRTHSGYSRVAITLHWLIAVLILGQVAGALLAESADRATAGQIIALHKSTGLTILALALFRLGWRIAHGFPRFPESTATWDAVLARGTHYAFYVLMIAVPLAGWALASSGPWPLSWYGLFDVPKLPVPQGSGKLWGNAHAVLAFSTVGLLVLHVAGALKHHLVDKDDVLARMLPLVRPRR